MSSSSRFYILECKDSNPKFQLQTNSLDRAVFDSDSSDWATLYTQVYSYDILSLTVDLGSALGLWMGLSCLSILDHVLAYCIYFKKYWKS